MRSIHTNTTVVGAWLERANPANRTSVRPGRIMKLVRCPAFRPQCSLSPPTVHKISFIFNILQENIELWPLSLASPTTKLNALSGMEHLTVIKPHMKPAKVQIFCF